MKSATQLALGVLCLALCTGCGVFTNRSRPIALDQLESEAGWIAVRNIEFVDQEEPTHCGYAVSAMTLGYWEQRTVSLAEVSRQMPKASTRGIAAATMRAYFRSQGFEAFVVQGELADLVHELSRGRPVIVGTVYREKDHFIAHYEVVTGINLRGEQIVTLDPRHGLRVSRFKDFYQSWALAKRVTVVVAARRAPFHLATYPKDHHFRTSRTATIGRSGRQGYYANQTTLDVLGARRGDDGVPAPWL